jgi:cytochrome P450
MLTLVLWLVVIIVSVPLLAVAGLLALLAYWTFLCSPALPAETDKIHVMQLLGKPSMAEQGQPSLLDRFMYSIAGAVWAFSLDPRGNSALHMSYQQRAIAEKKWLSVGIFTPGRLVAWLYHPLDVHQVLVDHRVKVTKHEEYRNVLGPILGTSGLVTEIVEDHHTVTRRMGISAFTTKQLDGYARNVIPGVGVSLLKTISAAIDAAAAASNSSAKNDEEVVIHIGGHLMHFSLSVALQSLFNNRIDEAGVASKSRIVRIASTILDNLQDINITMLLPHQMREIPLFQTPEYRKISGAMKELNRDLKQAVYDESKSRVELWKREYIEKQQHAAAGGRGEKQQQPGAADYLPDSAGILDFFVAQADLRGDKSQSEVDFSRDQLITVLGAATDTSQRFLLWALILLADPVSGAPVQEKLLEELEDICAAGTMPDYDDVASADTAPYLHAVVNEVLRLRAPVPVVGREVTCDYHLKHSGVTLKKGTHLGLLIATMHRNPLWWKPEGGDVEEFRPERWLLPGGPIRDKCPVTGAAIPADVVFAPFLPKWHKRNCIGEGLARRSILLELAALVRTFSFALPLNGKRKRSTEFLQDYAITQRPGEPTPLVVKRRSQ